MMKHSKSKRVVLDTNQIVAAGSGFLDPLLPVELNSARALLKAVLREHCGLYSKDILDEYIEKLQHYNHPKKRTGELIGLIIGSFDRVNVSSTSCSPQPSDPDDIVFILCALDGNADILVSDDPHLLKIKSGYVKPKIVNQSEGVSILVT